MTGVFLQKHGVLAGLLSMCLLLGVTLAAGLDAITTEDEVADDHGIAIATVAVALSAAIALYAKISRPQP